MARGRMIEGAGNKQQQQQHPDGGIKGSLIFLDLVQ